MLPFRDAVLQQRIASWVRGLSGFGVPRHVGCAAPAGDVTLPRQDGDQAGDYQDAGKDALTIREVAGSRSTRESDAPASSHPMWMRTIMHARTAVLTNASAAGERSPSREPANTAAIAT